MCGVGHEALLEPKKDTNLSKKSLGDLIMALTIGTNVASLQASAAASSVNRDLETSMARLSTGKRINSAADDAAGVAIASRLSYK
jgi:hypothetical protein